MTSTALERWTGERSEKLDYMEGVHRSVGGSGPGRRYTTEQVNHLYAVALSAEFQGFCRDLHDECSEFWVTAIPNATIRRDTRKLLIAGRRLDRGNASFRNIVEDFERFGVNVKDEAKSRDVRVPMWQHRLELLNGWRNAIAHQDFNPKNLGGLVGLTLKQVREWRGTCNGLATTIDRVMRDYLTGVVGTGPW